MPSKDDKLEIECETHHRSRLTLVKTKDGQLMMKAESMVDGVAVFVTLKYPGSMRKLADFLSGSFPLASSNATVGSVCSNGTAAVNRPGNKG